MQKLYSIFYEYWIEIALVPPFVMILCLSFYGQIYFSSWSNFALLTLPWLFVSVLSPIGCHWVRDIMMRRFTKLDDWLKRLVWSFAGYLFFTVGFAMLTYFILVFCEFAKQIPSEDSFVRLLVLATLSVLIIASMYEGVTYFDKWKEAIFEAEQLEKLTLESQFRSLQNQLNPHFLFNSFNVLSSLITENPGKAEGFVDELSNVYRYLLRSNEEELASVKEELHFIRSYFHLLETRHDTGITLDINVGGAFYEAKLPALSLQILVENAVKHNEISPEKPLRIEILTGKPIDNFGTDGKRPTIIVRNNLQDRATRPKSSRVGLENLRMRYELLGIETFQVEDDGSYFNVFLPLL